MLIRRQNNAINTKVELDASNRVLSSRELRRVAGIPRGQRLVASATPARIVKHGKLKIWTGKVPGTPVEEAVEQLRHGIAGIPYSSRKLPRTQRRTANKNF
jgi:hypothetical protein